MKCQPHCISISLELRQIIVLAQANCKENLNKELSTRQSFTRFSIEQDFINW
jgi:hypothetical protein